MLKLTTLPSDRFTVIYPKPDVLAVLATDQQGLVWQCNVLPVSQGGLLGVAGTKVSSLFWESESVTSAISLPDAVNASNSVLLSFENVLPYLERVLRSLSMTDTAATDFMQYWIPNFVRIAEKGQKIALRFVSQDEMDKHVSLDISPAPDVVNRVFMLFRGVSDTEAPAWSTSKRIAEHEWLDIAGVNSLAFDNSKYRVLEWGGCESKSAEG